MILRLNGRKSVLGAIVCDKQSALIRQQINTDNKTDGESGGDGEMVIVMEQSWGVYIGRVIKLGWAIVLLAISDEGLRRIAETYMTMQNADVSIYRDTKPDMFYPEDTEHPRKRSQTPHSITPENLLRRYCGENVPLAFSSPLPFVGEISI